MCSWTMSLKKCTLTTILQLKCSDQKITQLCIPTKNNTIFLNFHPSNVAKSFIATIRYHPNILSSENWTAPPLELKSDQPWCLCIICGRVGERGGLMLYLFEYFLLTYSFSQSIYLKSPTLLYEKYPVLQKLCIITAPPIIEFQLARERPWSAICCQIPSARCTSCAWYNLQCALIRVVAISCQHLSMQFSYKCDQCERAFSNITTLNKHERATLYGVHCAENDFQ